MAKQRNEADGPGTRALRRAARRFVRGAARALAAPDLPDTAVHDARKDLKRARTALRLLRPALDERIYRCDDALLRDVARALNTARDAKVLTQTLQSLCRRHRVLRRDRHVAQLLRKLQADQVRLRRRRRDHPQALQRMGSSLEQVSGRMTQWRVGEHGWSVLGPALKRIYKKGRHARPIRSRCPTDKALHEWRKQVKYLRYALELLGSRRSRRLSRLARRAERLTDLLGKAHDLAILARRARALATRRRAPLRALFVIIDQQREGLGLEALSSGEQLYQPKPGEWQRPLERYWAR